MVSWSVVTSAFRDGAKQLMVVVFSTLHTWRGIEVRVRVSGRLLFNFILEGFMLLKHLRSWECTEGD